MQFDMPEPKGSYTFNLPKQDYNYDPEAFDHLIRSHGVTFEHYRAMQCPIGVTDKYDSRKGNHQGHGCINGFLLRKAGVVTASFAGNSTKYNQADMGLVDGSSVRTTLPRFYDDPSDKPVSVTPFDRFYVKNLTATAIHWQLVEANITGIDRVQYPVTSIEYIIDANGVEYSPDDYRIEDGKVCWVSNNRPGVDPKTNKGTVYSIRYAYTPYWVCAQLLHEIRVSQIENPYTGERTLERFPYAILLQREVVFDNQREKEASQASGLGDIYLPPTQGSFGRR